MDKPNKQENKSQEIEKKKAPKQKEATNEIPKHAFYRG